MAPPSWRLPGSWVRIFCPCMDNSHLLSDVAMVCWPISWQQRDTKATESIFVQEFLGAIIQNLHKRIFTYMPSIQHPTMTLPTNLSPTSNPAFSSSETTQMSWHRGFRYFRQNTTPLDIFLFHAVHGPLTLNLNALQQYRIPFQMLTLLIVWIWAETEVILAHTRCTGSGWPP